MIVSLSSRSSFESSFFSTGGLGVVASGGGLVGGEDPQDNTAVMDKDRVNNITKVFIAIKNNEIDQGIS